MHELGIVFSVADKVLEIARDNDLTEIVAITMQIGEISSVIPDYLKKCPALCRPILQTAGAGQQTVQRSYPAVS